MLYFRPHNMKTLYIETSTEKSCLAITDENLLITLPLSGGPELSKKLALEVHNLLKTNNFHPEQIAIGRGPGSYTGVRVGAALGKALAFGWGIPLAEFCSLKTFIPVCGGPFAVLVDARMGGIYVLTHSMDAPKLLSPVELEEELRDIPLLLSPHPILIERRIQRTCVEASPSFPLDLKAAGALR